MGRFQNQRSENGSFFFAIAPIRAPWGAYKSGKRNLLPVYYFKCITFGVQMQLLFYIKGQPPYIDIIKARFGCLSELFVYFGGGVYAVVTVIDRKRNAMSSFTIPVKKSKWNILVI